MADINSQAKDLTENLKKGTGAARGLATELAGVNAALGTSVKHAAELAEAMAKVAKVSESVAVGIGTAFAIIGTVIAATIGWHEKTKEIANEIRNINAETERYYALAKNDVRLAQEIQINDERDKALQALEKERGFLGEIGKTVEEMQKKGGILGTLANLLPKGGFHLYNYDDIKKAIEERANSERTNLEAGINRQYGRERESLGYQILQNSPNLVFQDPYARQIAENELARQDAIRKQREQGQDAGMTKAQIDDLVAGINAQFDNIKQQTINQHIKAVGDEIGTTFADSIAGGIAKGIESGSIAKGFKALAGGLLSGLGHVLLQVGTESLLAANLFAKFVGALLLFDPPGAIAASLELIALGGILEGLGGALAGSGGGGGGGGYGGGGYGGGGTIVDRGIINPLSPLGYTSGALSGSIQPRQPIVNNFMLVGPRDPTVQRTIQEIVTNASKRGGV